MLGMDTPGKVVAKLEKQNVEVKPLQSLEDCRMQAYSSP
jgi:hypothetical protein